MAYELKQDLRLKQELIITPQLKQAIKLLQLNQLDLLDHIQQEMVENPALEEIPDSAGDEGTVDQTLELDERRQSAERELADQVNSTSTDQAEGDWDGFQEANNAAADANKVESAEARTAEDWERILAEQDRGKEGSGAGVASRDDLPPIESTLSANTTLGEHLLWQLRMQSCTLEEQVAADVIIHNLDDRGYLELTLEEVAEVAEVDIDDVEGAQMIVQALDPLGCGSRTLEECLLVQVKAKFPEDPFFPVIVARHLKDLENRDYEDVAEALEMELEDVIEYHKMIQEELAPWPGRGYADAEPRYITPDVQVFKVGDQWQVVLNEDGLPKLRISNYYRDVLANAKSKDDREYIKEKLESADFLIKSIYKRQATIEKVVRSILARQHDFFERGEAFLKPMVLRDVAEEVGVHESTVSRVTSNKYMQCPHGILELKYFFTSGVHTDDGEDMASAAVKRRIKELVSAENPKQPLSDADLADKLGAEGIKCARRTVAKYREALGILPSSKRKSLF